MKLISKEISAAKTPLADITNQGREDETQTFRNYPLDSTNTFDEKDLGLNSLNSVHQANNLDRDTLKFFSQLEQFEKNNVRVVAADKLGCVGLHGVDLSGNAQVLLEFIVILFDF